MRLIHSSQLPSGVPLAEVHASMGSVSEDRLRGWVEKISIPRHYRAQPEANRATARWLAEQFEAWGYQVRMQGTCGNVVVWPRGESRERILVGAHYDSVPETPGADDNGSAVAAMLGCAEILARVAPQAPVCFVAFNCEEDGMVGSAEFAGGLEGAEFKVKEAHILEMAISRMCASLTLNSAPSRPPANSALPTIPSSSQLKATKQTGACGATRARISAQPSIAATALPLSSAPGVSGTLS